MRSHKTTWSKGHGLYTYEPIKMSYHPAKFFTWSYNTTWSKVNGNLEAGVHHSKLHLAKFGGHRHCDNEDDFSLSRDLTKSRDERSHGLYRQEPIKLSYHPAKFSGHRHWGSKDVIILLCHKISQDHMIKDDVTLHAGAHQGRLPSCQVSWS